jgi:hypothetical protein
MESAASLARCSFVCGCLLGADAGCTRPVLALPLQWFPCRGPVRLPVWMPPSLLFHCFASTSGAHAHCAVYVRFVMSGPRFMLWLQPRCLRPPTSPPPPLVAFLAWHAGPTSRGCGRLFCGNCTVRDWLRHYGYVEPVLACATCRSPLLTGLVTRCVCVSFCHAMLCCCAVLCCAALCCLAFLSFLAACLMCATRGRLLLVWQVGAHQRG